MALQCMSDWEDVADFYWWMFEDLSPPRLEWGVYSDVEECIRRRSFYKCVCRIWTIRTVVVESSDCSERTCTRLIEGGRIGVGTYG